MPLPGESNAKLLSQVCNAVPEHSSMHIDPLFMMTVTIILNRQCTIARQKNYSIYHPDVLSFHGFALRRRDPQYVYQSYASARVALHAVKMSFDSSQNLGTLPSSMNQFIAEAKQQVVKDLNSPDEECSK